MGLSLRFSRLRAGEIVGGRGSRSGYRHIVKAEVIRVDGGWDFGFGSRMRAE